MEEKRSQNDFDEDIFEKWKFRMDEIELLVHLINSGNEFFLYGVKGCGKTTLIRDLMDQLRINYVKINCIQARTKADILHQTLIQLTK